MIPEWALMEEALAEEVSTEEVSIEEVCVKNSIEEWNLTEGKKRNEEKNSIGDMILTQDSRFGGYYFFNKSQCIRTTSY
ncbi:MAG: hypothetical protein ACK5H4_20925 [Lacrimispora sphenoides]